MTRRRTPLARAFAAPRTGMLTLRSFLRSPLPAAALAALMLVPLLYSGMYLWSFWDPFGRMEHLPVALVNEDRPVEVDGREADAGGELADTLLEGGDLDWRLVDAGEAARGLDDGTYYVTLTIPSSFSENVTSPSRDRENPVPALLVAHYNDANGFTVRQLAGSAFEEVRDAAAGSAGQRLPRRGLPGVQRDPQPDRGGGGGRRRPRGRRGRRGGGLRGRASTTRTRARGR